ncbi:beta and beta-prime subunits of DNA dependent RNA-polymerase [Ramaria rubella]|nr:beta and beta-prime subunits of DNA dependent RNA-polymerase [Ramaria rubella]
MEWPSDLSQAYSSLIRAIKGHKKDRSLAEYRTTITKYYSKIAMGTSGFVIDGLLSGKDGIFRGILRDEVLIPKTISEKLVIGDMCFRHNVGELKKDSKNGKIFWDKKGNMVSEEEIIEGQKYYRCLRNVASSFNADFDGDEMNIFADWSVQAQAELEFLYDNKKVVKFYKDLQKIVCPWLEFNISIHDCMWMDGDNKKKDDMISLVDRDSYNTSQKDFFEWIYNKCLDDYGNTSLHKMIESGGKGNIINMSQIMASVGHQYISDDYGEKEKDNLTSMGFVKSSYMEGLDPDEFMIHLVASRTGVINTGVQTSSTGYTSRKASIIMADCTLDYMGNMTVSVTEVKVENNTTTQVDWSTSMTSGVIDKEYYFVFFKMVVSVKEVKVTNKIPRKSVGVMDKTYSFIDGSGLNIANIIIDNTTKSEGDVTTNHGTSPQGSGSLDILVTMRK